MTDKRGSLKEAKRIVADCIDKTRSQFSITVSEGLDLEHLKIHGRRIDIFAGDIEQIEQKTGFRFHGLNYWNEPDFMQKYPAMPKYMKDYTAGNHIEVRFVRTKK